MIQAESRILSQKFTLISAILFVFSLSAPAQQGRQEQAQQGRQAPSSPTSEKLKTESELMMESMQLMSQQLGVTCTTCHNPKNWKDSSKREFKVSLDHMKITQTLIDQGFDGTKYSKATCYTCHQGELNPPHLKKDFKVFTK